MPYKFGKVELECSEFTVIELAHSPFRSRSTVPKEDTNTLLKSIFEFTLRSNTPYSFPVR